MLPARTHSVSFSWALSQDLNSNLPNPTHPTVLPEPRKYRCCFPKTFLHSPLLDSKILGLVLKMEEKSRVGCQVPTCWELSSHVSFGISGTLHRASYGNPVWHHSSLAGMLDKLPSPLEAACSHLKEQFKNAFTVQTLMLILNTNNTVHTLVPQVFQRRMKFVFSRCFVFMSLWQEIIFICELNFIDKVKKPTFFFFKHSHFCLSSNCSLS